MNKIEKIPEINARIMQVIDYYSNKNVTKFANSIEITQQTLNRLFIIDKRTGKYPLATTEIIKKISEMYDIDANWILTGKGDMLKSSSKISPSGAQVPAPEQSDQSPEAGCPLCKDKDERIKDLKETIDILKENIKSLGNSFKISIETQQSVIHQLQDQIDDLQQQHFDDEEDITSQAG